MPKSVVLLNSVPEVNIAYDSPDSPTTSDHKIVVWPPPVSGWAVKDALTEVTASGGILSSARGVERALFDRNLISS